LSRFSTDVAAAAGRRSLRGGRRGAGAAARRGGDFPLTRKNALSVEGWRPLYQAAKAGADNLQPGLTGTLERELTFLDRAWPRDLPKGVIHAISFPTTCSSSAITVGMIDFYFACTDTLAYDIAICSMPGASRPIIPTTSPRARPAARLHEHAPALGIRARRTAAARARRGLRFLLTRLVDWLDVPPGRW